MRSLIDDDVLGIGRSLIRELRRALGDQAVLLGVEDAVVVEPAGHDDLATLAERIRHDAAVGDGQLRGAAVAIGDVELEVRALAACSR